LTTKNSEQVEDDLTELPSSSLLLLVKGVDVPNKLLNRTSTGTIIPLATISNASNFAREPHSTALGDIILLASRYTCSKQVDSFPLVADAMIQLLEIDAMLHSTVLNKISIGNIVIVRCQAVGEAKINLRVWVDFCSAKFNDVSQALGRPMHTGNGIGFGIDPGEEFSWSTMGEIIICLLSNKAECEIDSIADLFHRW
jgi:hypothetical protein